MAAPTLETVALSRPCEGVVVVTLNRPKKLNAINSTMWECVAAVWR